MAKSLEPDDYEILPPQQYDEGQVRRDLLRLSIRGLSIEPYIQQAKTKSVWYSTRERKRVEAIGELIKAKTDVIRSAHTSMLEAAMVQPDYINREINAKIEDQIIAKMERELKFKELNNKLMLEENRGERVLEKTELKHEIEMAQLRKERAALYQTPTQSESAPPREKTRDEAIAEEMAQVRRDRAAMEEGQLKDAQERIERRRQAEENVAIRLSKGLITPKQADEELETIRRIFGGEL